MSVKVNPNEWAARRKAKIEQAKQMKEERQNNIANGDDYTFSPQINKKPGYLKDSARSNDNSQNPFLDQNNPFERPLPGKINYGADTNSANNDNYSQQNVETLRNQTDNLKKTFVKSIQEETNMNQSYRNNNTDSNQGSSYREPDDGFSNMLRGGNKEDSGGWNNDTSSSDYFGDPNMSARNNKKAPRPRTDNNLSKTQSNISNNSNHSSKPPMNKTYTNYNEQELWNLSENKTITKNSTNNTMNNTMSRGIANNYDSSSNNNNIRDPLNNSISTSNNPKARLSLLKSKLKRSDSSNQPVTTTEYTSNTSYTSSSSSISSSSTSYGIPKSAPHDSNSLYNDTTSDREGGRSIKRTMSHNQVGSVSDFGLNHEDVNMPYSNSARTQGTDRNTLNMKSTGNLHMNNNNNSNSNNSGQYNNNNSRMSTQRGDENNYRSGRNNGRPPSQDYSTATTNRNNTKNSSNSNSNNNTLRQSVSKSNTYDEYPPPDSSRNCQPSSSSSYPSAAAYPVDDLDIEEPDYANQLQCPDCGRKFNPVPYQKHVKICNKVFQKSRKVFDSKLMRVADNPELVKILTKKEQEEKRAANKATAAATLAATKKKALLDERVIQGSENDKPKWKGQSEAFRDAMRAAREVTKAVATGAPLPPPVASKPDPSLILCPTCGRRFNAKAAERHIPQCANIQAKPTALKKGSGGAGGLKGTGTAPVKLARSRF